MVLRKLTCASLYEIASNNKKAISWNIQTFTISFKQELQQCWAQYSLPTTMKSPQLLELLMLIFHQRFSLINNFVKCIKENRWWNISINNFRSCGVFKVVGIKNVFCCVVSIYAQKKTGAATELDPILASNNFETDLEAVSVKYGSCTTTTTCLFWLS